MDQGEITRAYFFTLPVWAKVGFYVVALIALVTFFRGVWIRVRRYRSGRRDARDVPSSVRAREAIAPS